MNLKFLSAILTVTLFIGFSACSSDTTAEIPTPSTRVIYDGATITFEKADGVSPDDAANQDRITDNVWITRGNEGGEIYNAKSENNSSKGSSPSGTQWAVGSIGDIDNLQFADFRDAVKPRQVVGQDLVLFLTQEEVFIPIKFTKWSTGKDNKGGFAYERATE